MHGGTAGSGDCHGCGFCLLLAGLVEFPGDALIAGTE